MKAVTVLTFASAWLLWGPCIYGQELANADESAVQDVAAQQEAQPKIEGWRYKWHNGHWWYFQPNKQWLFWNGLSWSSYSPAAYQAWWTGSGQRVATGYRGVVRRGPSWLGTGNYTVYPYWPYNADATTPSAHLGQAMTGGMSGPEAARTARVGENW